MDQKDAKISPFIIVSMMMHLGLVGLFYVFGMLNFTPKFEEITEMPVEIVSAEQLAALTQPEPPPEVEQPPIAPEPKPEPKIEPQEEVKMPEPVPEKTEIELEENLPDPVEPPELPKKPEVAPAVEPTPKPIEPAPPEPKAEPVEEAKLELDAPAPKKKPTPPPQPKVETKPEPQVAETPKVEAAKPEPTKPRLNEILAEMARMREQESSRERPKVYDFRSDTPVRTLGSQEGLTREEESALRRQIETCWNPPTGMKGLSDMSVQIRIDVDRARQVIRSAVVHDLDRMRQDAAYRALAESANRAISNPRCAPLNLPPQKYDIWKSMILNFDPSKTFQ